MRRILILTATLFLAAACRTATMAVDPSLSAVAEPMAVTGANPRVWNRPLAFGPFAVSSVSEGGEWSWSFPILGVEAGARVQPYRFVLSEGASRGEVACVTRELFVERKGLEVDPSLGRLPVLRCAIRFEDGSAEELVLRRTGTRFGGALGELKVTSIHAMEGGSFDTVEPTGYVIREGGRPVAAVETINAGRVWIDPAARAEDRLRVAATAAALLLFDPEP